MWDLVRLGRLPLIAQWRVVPLHDILVLEGVCALLFLVVLESTELAWSLLELDSWDIAGVRRL